MKLFEAISFYAGGPGSGRHPGDEDGSLDTLPYFKQLLRPSTKPDKSPAFGKEHTDSDGQRWRLTGQNGEHTPYFSKVTGKNKVGSKQFVLNDGEQVAQSHLRSLNG